MLSKYTLAFISTVAIIIHTSTAAPAPDFGDFIDEIKEGFGKMTSKVVEEVHEFASAGKSIGERIKSDFRNGKDGDESLGQAKPTGALEANESGDKSAAGKAHSSSVAAVAIAVAAVAQFF